jgi:tRNA A-37 threonylcarbamoyl transferase component Bud32
MTQLIRFIPILLLWLYANSSSATQLKCTRWGISCDAVLAGQVSTKRELAWKNIDEIYLTPRRENHRILDRYICFKPKYGKPLKVKLEKIATAKHWTELLAAINVWSNAYVDLDPNLFDNLNVDQHDPTYTQLWLDALLAPPRREKLQALTVGTSLKQGEYILEHKLGTGGQGSAYLARTPDGRRVVLKEYILPLYVEAKVRRQALDSFEHEASILRSLKHPNIVELLDCFIEDHRGYLVLEHIEGMNLREYVAQHGPLDAESVKNLALSICDILTYLHGSSPPIVHRDLSPDNLMLRSDGSVKLIDFMVAQQNTDTATATVVGKHAYLPPEQFRGRAVAQSDIYALGCTMYFLLTGDDPEPLTTSHPILVRDTVGGTLDTIVATATELDLDKRFHSAQDLKQALMSVGGETIDIARKQAIELS